MTRSMNMAMRTCQWLVAAALLTLSAAAERSSGDAGRNLVSNSDFSHGLKDWQVRFAEPNEEKYARNHQWVKDVFTPDDGPGFSLEFKLTPEVAASEGVKAVTGLMELADGVKYEFGADVQTRGPAVKIFVEGYVRDPEQRESGNDQYPGFRRVYRKTIHVKGTIGEWQAWRQTINPPARYEPTHAVIKLYAYLNPGLVYFRNVVLQPTRE